MRPLCLVSLFTSLLSILALAQSASVINPPLVTRSLVPNVSAQPEPAMRAKIAESYGKLPLSFEANHGQADGRVKFLSRTGAYTLFLTGDEAVLTLQVGKAKSNFPVETRLAASPEVKSAPIPDGATGAVLRMKLRNANPGAKITGTDELAGTSNYFIGNDRTKWRTNVPTYAKVKYAGIYSGIDLVYYGNQRQLEYDFIVAPGADPRLIAFDVNGARRICRDEHGDLVVKIGKDDEVRWHKPVVYQEKDGARQLVAARYAVTDGNRVGFEVAKYDAKRPLYIDPLLYSTFLGGSGDDFGYGIAVDTAGNAYVTGLTGSTDFPTKNPLQPVFGGYYDAFVTKINAAGSALVYSTYLGGSGYEQPGRITVDSSGAAYVTGYTASTNFPTMNPLQATYGGGSTDAFVTKINPAGSALVYSTYLGGSGNDFAYGIAVDSAHNTYVTGYTASTDFPTKNPLQPSNAGGSGSCLCDAFVAKINPAGTAFVYSTYLGGSDRDVGNGIAADSAGSAYITGWTLSTDFPTKNPLQATNAGNGDVFVTKINPSGSAFVYSTYLGGSTGEDNGSAIAVDGAGSAYVTGYTHSTDFPTKNPMQAANHGLLDAFVTKINAAGAALVYSTYLGGGGSDSGNGIAVDRAGNAYIVGDTNSTDFPTKNPLQKLYGGGAQDAYVSKISPKGASLVYSTYLGGSGEDWGTSIAVDGSGHAYIAGATSDGSFPTVKALQSAYGGGTYDAFVSKIEVAVVTTTALTSSPNSSIYGQAATLTAVVSSKSDAPPDGETVSFTEGKTILGTETLSGGSASFTTSTLPAGTDSIKAAYDGDSNFAASTSKVVSQVVIKATTTTALTSSKNPSNVGQSVTFTASETPQFSGTIKGSVTFYDGATALKTVPLSAGVAKFATSTLIFGAHTITATYNGSTSFTGSSDSLIQTVN